MYAVQTESEFIVFTGSKCRGKTRAEYAKFANIYLQKLQSYEKAPQKIRFLEQSELGLEFFKLWGIDDMPESPFAEQPAYNFYYQNVSQVVRHKMAAVRRNRRRLRGKASGGADARVRATTRGRKEDETTPLYVSPKRRAHCLQLPEPGQFKYNFRRGRPRSRELLGPLHTRERRPA